MSDSTTSTEATDPCKCCYALCEFTNTLIEDGTTIATGLNWFSLQDLMCKASTCLLCRKLERDPRPMSRPYWEAEDVSHENESEDLSKLQLMLRFDAKTRSTGWYNCLVLSTAMVDPELYRRYGSGLWEPGRPRQFSLARPQERLDIVGDFGTNDRINDLVLGARRLLQDQFDPNILRSWLAKCEKHHGHMDSQTDVAKYSIDLLVEQGRLRFINVRTHTLVTAATPERYLALSYVWGHVQAPHRAHLSASAYERSRANYVTGYFIKDWTNLPRTIRDAAELVKDIGEEYLWVDALCINQNDPVDRNCLVAEMGAIYGYSVITIVSAADHANAGLPGISVGSRNCESFTQISIGSQKLQLVEDCPTMDVVINQSKWSSRGWTFQELLLSRRAAIFTEKQVYFICLQGEQAEAYTGTGQFSKNYHKEHFHRQRVVKDDEASRQLVFNLIQEYTARQLTHASDRFNAFMGVATMEQSADVTSKTCITLRGLPSRCFWESLLWETRTRANSWETPTKYKSSYDEKPPVRIETNLDQSLALPSWSWVGWTGRVLYLQHQWSRSVSPRFDVILHDETNIVLKPTNGAGQFPYWEPWPFEPKPYIGRTPNTVTLHMWAPCVECHFIPIEDANERRSFAEDPRVTCAIVLRHQGLTTAALESLYGLSDKFFYERKDFLGIIRPPKEAVENKQHHRLRQMVIFPQVNTWPDVILLHENPKDQDTVCREHKMRTGMLNVDLESPDSRYDRSTLHTTLFSVAQHKYIRMQ